MTVCDCLRAVVVRYKGQPSSTRRYAVLADSILRWPVTHPFHIMKISAITGLIVLLALSDSANAKNDKEKKKKGGLAEASFVLVGDSTTNNNTVTPNCTCPPVYWMGRRADLFQLEDGAMASALLFSPASDVVRIPLLLTPSFV
jgi:hypothetical protein